MKNLIYIIENSEIDVSAIEELAKQMNRSVFLHAQQLCHFNPVTYNDTVAVMTADSCIHVINNYSISNAFDTIILGWPFANTSLLMDIAEKTTYQGCHCSIFNLVNQEPIDLGLPIVTPFERERDVDYIRMANNCLVKVSEIDTTYLTDTDIAFYLLKTIQKAEK